jgi:hypothetical protein
MRRPDDNRRFFLIYPHSVDTSRPTYPVPNSAHRAVFRPTHHAQRTALLGLAVREQPHSLAISAGGASGRMVSGNRQLGKPANAAGHRPRLRGHIADGDTHVRARTKRPGPVLGWALVHRRITTLFPPARCFSGNHLERRVQGQYSHSFGRHMRSRHERYPHPARRAWLQEKIAGPYEDSIASLDDGGVPATRERGYLRCRTFPDSCTPVPGGAGVAALGL